jgi:hypothetical protein
MQDDNKKRTDKPHKLDGHANYEVGYAKPPASTRFKPGQSGNLNGRPKGARNKILQFEKESIQDIITTEASRLVKVIEGGKQVSISIATAVVRSIAVNAAKGHPLSQKLFTDLLTKTEAERRQEYERAAQCVADYHMYWEEIFYEHRRNSLPLPKPAPHPHDVKFDTITGKISVRGPMTREEQVNWEAMSDRVECAKESIAEYQILLNDPKHLGIKHWVEEEIVHETKILAILEPVLKGWRKRS